MTDSKSPYLFNQNPDLKLEFVLGELLESGMDPDEVVVNALGIFRRRYGKDIAGNGIRDYKANKRQYLNIDINRNGIYDLLPRGLFHQPQNRKSNISSIQAIEEYKLQMQIEKDTRSFFLPFEQELYRLLLFLETEERKSIFDIQNVMRSQEYIDFWNIPDYFNDRQICNLLYILPLASFIVGNYKLTKLCFESILNDRIEITESLPVNHRVTEAGFTELNSVCLGVDFVIGENYREVSYGLDVFIHPSQTEDIIGYLDGGEKLKMLRFISDYFLPFDCDVTTHIVSEGLFELSEEHHHSRLGISTCI